MLDSRSGNGTARLVTAALVGAGLLAMGGSVTPAAAAGKVALGWRPSPVVRTRIEKMRVERLGRPSGRPEVWSTATAKVRVSAAKEGSFVSIDGYYFRIAGGAPLYITTWSIFGGGKPSMKVTEAQFDALNYYPADGTFIKTAQDHRVYRFVAGAPIYVSSWAAYGGRAQPTVLVDQTVLTWAHREDFPYGHVAIVPLDLQFTKDGHLLMDQRIFVRGGQTSKIYKLLGGSLRYVPSWAPYGGPKPAITVDQATIDRVGERAGPYRFIQPYPIDNWPLTKRDTGQLFVMAGGAPIYVASPNLAHTWFNSLVPPKVDQVLLDGLRAVPADRTRIAGLPMLPTDSKIDSGLELNVYLVQSGVPVLQGQSLLSDLLSGSNDVSYVDQVAIDRAGTGGVYDHLLAAP